MCKEKTADFHLCLLVYQYEFLLLCICRYQSSGVFLAKISNLSIKNNVLFKSWIITPQKRRVAVSPFLKISECLADEPIFSIGAWTSLTIPSRSQETVNTHTVWGIWLESFIFKWLTKCPLQCEQNARKQVLLLSAWFFLNRCNSYQIILTWIFKDLSKSVQC